MRKRRKNLLSEFCVFCASSRQTSNGDALLADLNSYGRPGMSAMCVSKLEADSEQEIAEDTEEEFSVPSVASCSSRGRSISGSDPVVP